MASSVWNSGGGAPQDAYSYARSLAVAALGLPAEQMLFHFDPYFLLGDAGKVVVAGGSASRSGQIQALRLATGASAGSAIALVDGATAAEPQSIVAGATKKFWIGMLMGLSVAPPVVSGDLAGFYGQLSGTTRMIIGARGASSLTNFVAFGDTGGTIDSGLAFDATRRLHQFWRDGTTGNYQIDSLPKVQGDIRPSTNITSRLIVDNTGSGAVDLQAEFVWRAIAVAKE
jgi:hypothetical protein